MQEQPKIFINHYLDRNSFQFTYHLPEGLQKEVEKVATDKKSVLYRKNYEENMGRLIFESNKEKASFLSILGEQLAEIVEKEHEKIVEGNIENYKKNISAFKQILRGKGFSVQDVQEIEAYPGINMESKIESLIKSSDIFISILNYEQVLIHKHKLKAFSFSVGEAEMSLFADSFLKPIIDEFYIHSLKACLNRKKSLYIVPIIIANSPASLDFTAFPFLSNLSVWYLDDFESLNTKDAINRLIGGYSKFKEDKILTETNEKEQKKKIIEKNAPEFVQETLQRLKKNERWYSYIAIGWNILGFLALLAGAALLFYYGIIRNPTTLPSWQVIIFSSVKAALVVVVLIAVAKYTFDLAKSNMNEALKNSDRIHAIEFGKFYLEVYGGEIDSKEMKEVFQNWNLQQDSSFLTLDPDKFDPKLIENLNQLIVALSNMKNEGGTIKVKKKVSDEG